MHGANRSSKDSSLSCPSSRCSLPKHKQHPFSTPWHSCSPQCCSASTWLRAAWESPPLFFPLSQLYHQRGGQILPLCQHSVLEKQDLPGGSAVGSQECMSSGPSGCWAPSSSHMQLQELPNLTAHPVLQGQQQWQCWLACKAVWQMPGLRLCPLLLLPMSSLLPCTLLWALNWPHGAATAVTELPPRPEESSTC